MKVKCPYCDYEKPDEPLSTDILVHALTAEGEHNVEDYILWMQRLLEVHSKKYGFTNYRGIKVHIGRKHKGAYNWPTSVYNQQELKVMAKFGIHEPRTT